MILTLIKLKEEIRKGLNKIKFHPHFYDQVLQRPYLDEELVIKTLRDFNNYLGYQTQEVRGEERQR